MYNKYRIGDSDQCTCGTAAMTAEHLLEECPSYNAERAETWEQAATLQDKLYGDAENLELTTSFFKLINVNSATDFSGLGLVSLAMSEPTPK